MAGAQITPGASSPPITYSQLPMACRVHWFVVRIEKDSPIEIIDAACRISGRWGHCDLATGRPVRWAICQGHKGSGGALQDSAATYRESIGGDIRRCNRGRGAVVVSANWWGVRRRELLPPSRLRTPAFADGAEMCRCSPPGDVTRLQTTRLLAMQYDAESEM